MLTDSFLRGESILCCFNHAVLFLKLPLTREMVLGHCVIFKRSNDISNPIML